MTIVEKQILAKYFKVETFKALTKMLLSMCANTYKSKEAVEEKDGKIGKNWDMFKKYPNAEILPLPQKSEPTKTAKAANSQPESIALVNYQTLFR